MHTGQFVYCGKKGTLSATVYVHFPLASPWLANALFNTYSPAFRR
jgi:hypothetical protein